jgi:hypothetical protein
VVGNWCDRRVTGVIYGSRQTEIVISDGSISLTQERCVQTRCPAASFRCRIPLCRPVRPEGNIIDLIRLNGGIRGAAQFWKKTACSTYPLAAPISTAMWTRDRLAIYLILATVGQVVIYAFWAKGDTWPFYFDPRIGFWVLQTLIVGHESSGPSFLSWASVLWLAVVAPAIHFKPKAVRVYRFGEPLMALPSIGFFGSVLWANMSPAHGFSLPELTIPVVVFVLFTVLPLIGSRRLI